MRYTRYAVLVAGLLSGQLMAEESAPTDSDASQVEEVTTGEASAPQADEQDTQILSKRIEEENEIAFHRLAFLPHYATYFSPASYYSGYGDAPLSEARNYKPLETEFQISFKFPLRQNLLLDKDMVFLAYTQRSFWQLYTESAPFRETNYQPELVYAMSDLAEVNNVKLTAVAFSLNHQSNGQPEPQSRSWNRLMGNVAFEYHRFSFGGQLWWRIPESADVDDNPDITDYLGHGRFLFAYRPGKDQLLTLGLQNHLESDFRRGSTELTWSFPIRNSRLKWYLRAFAGYGDSMADYNRFIQRYSIGLAMHDVI